MIMTNFLKSRKSVREFRNKKVNQDLLDKINQNLSELEEEYKAGGIKFKLYEYGENISGGLKGRAGYAGVMIDSPHYIAVDLKNEDESTVIYSAYLMEKLVTKLVELGLDSCWVSVYNVDPEIRKNVFGESTNCVNFVLAFGYSKRRNPFVQETFSERLAVEDIVFEKELGKGTDIEFLENRGLADIFFYVRFAPSIKNRQPWRFIVTDDKVHLLVKCEDKDNPPLIDAGIIMYYLEKLFELQGTKNAFKLLDGFVHEGDADYKYIAEYQL